MAVKLRKSAVGGMAAKNLGQRPPVVSFCEDCFSPPKFAYDYEHFKKIRSAANIPSRPRTFNLGALSETLPLPEASPSTSCSAATPWFARATRREMGPEKSIFQETTAVLLPSLSFKDRVVATGPSPPHAAPFHHRRLLFPPAISPTRGTPKSRTARLAVVCSFPADRGHAKGAQHAVYGGAQSYAFTGTTTRKSPLAAQNR